MDAPTRKRKNGNTRSVRVHPCHLACSRGAYTCPQLPGLFTRIMRAMVMPRKISMEYIRLGSDIFILTQFYLITKFTNNFSFKNVVICVFSLVLINFCSIPGKIQSPQSQIKLQIDYNFGKLNFRSQM